MKQKTRRYGKDLLKQQLGFRHIELTTWTDLIPWWLSRSGVRLQCRRPGFNPWVGKSPQRRKWQPIPVFLPGESHGQRSLGGYSPLSHKSRTQLSDFTFTFHFHALEKEWQPTPVFLPGESQGRGSLVGCPLWGHTQSDTTEATQQQQQYLLLLFYFRS